MLLIHGLGLSGGAWWRTVDALAPSMRVITFDHRGIGQSESLTYAYTTEAMADDAVSILDALDIDRRPRLRILARRNGRPAGRAPSPRASPVARPRRDALRRPADERFRTPTSWRSSSGAPGCRPRRRRGRRCRTTTVRAAGPNRPTGSPRTSSAGSRTRSTSAPTRRSCSRRRCTTATAVSIGSRAPTLVVHGARDRIIPVANAHMTAERVPGAELQILRGRGPPLPHRGAGGGRGHRRVLRRPRMSERVAARSALAAEASVCLN